MIEAALLVAVTLVVTGVTAAAGIDLQRDRSATTVAIGALLLLMADGQSVTAGAMSRSLATAAGPLILGLAALAAFGRRPATLVAVGAACLAGPVRQAFSDPFHDARCWEGCYPNPLALLPRPEWADAAQAVGMVSLVGVLVILFLRGSLTHRLAALALCACALLGATSDRIEASVCAALVAEVVVAVALLRARTAGARLSEATLALAASVDPQEALTTALGQQVVIGYQIKGGPLVDRVGKQLPPAAPGLEVVHINGASGAIAELRGELSGLSPAALLRALQGPPRLALENSRLAAEASFRAAEVRASSERLVTVAEAGRRALERDLHDGAQRHVLNLGLAVRAESRISPEVRDEASARVRTVLDQLRSLAHSISPPELATGGLARAWAALADRSQVPVDATPPPPGLRPLQSLAAYRLVEAVVRTATGPVSVRVCRGDAAWLVQVRCEAAGAVPEAIRDRFHALEGTLRSVQDGVGWRHTGELPITHGESE